MNLLSFTLSLVPSLASLLLALALFAGCSTQPPIREFSEGYPLGYMERGIASWYGPGFHGNTTANGERYDMHQLTAAHRTLPLGSIVVVRSLSTGRQVTVRINDRGPFLKGRILDLSFAAAKALGITGTGIDHVELKVIDFQGRARAFGALRVQVASFAELSHAQALADRLKGRYGDVRILTVDLATGRRYRVQVGHFATERQALAIGEQLNSLLNVECLVVRDDG